MFNVRNKNAKVFSAYFQAINLCLDEITFRADSEGIIIRGLDPSRLAMFDVAFPPSMFEDYQCNETLTVNLDSLAKLLELAEQNDSVELALEKESGKFAVTFKDIATRKFTIPKLETYEEKVPPPKISFLAKAVLPTKQLLGLLNNARSVSDNVVIKTTPESLLFEAENNLSTAALSLEKKDMITLDCPQPQRAIFSLTYLIEIVNALSEVCETVTVQYSTDMPLELSFKLNHPGKLLFYLAPKIEIE